MKDFNLYQAIVRFLSKEIDKPDLESLDAHLKDNPDDTTFKQLVEVDYLSSLGLKNYEVEKAKKSIHSKIRERQKQARVVRIRRWSAAASILLVLGVSLYILDQKKSAIDETIASGSNRAILTLENGKQVLLGEGEAYEGDQLSSNSEELVYDSGASRQNQGSYNYLVVPRGGQFSVKLSDGTKIWVNSDSKLKYPKKFIQGKDREVELLYGEAYFDVSPSQENQGTPFRVITKDQTVTVLGTEFNIRAYEGEPQIITTLTEGKVEVEKASSKEVLAPNQQSIVDNQSAGIAIEDTDASVNSSWVRGLFIFKDKPLLEIMEVLSRWYDVDASFDAEEIKNIPFTGVLERTSTLNELLEIIEESSGNDFTFQLKNRIIYLK